MMRTPGDVGHSGSCVTDSGYRPRHCERTRQRLRMPLVTARTGHVRGSSPRALHHWGIEAVLAEGRASPSRQEIADSSREPQHISMHNGWEEVASAIEKESPPDIDARCFGYTPFPYLSPRRALHKHWASSLQHREPRRSNVQYSPLLLAICM